ncbi:MAG: hypothetical protein HYU28_01625 [Actinobacteria bacterium]|nr:hypothetical protein [Actinomycetota bacterium]
MRRLVAVAVIAMTALVGTPGGASAQQSDLPSEEEIEQCFVDKINALRAGQGLEKLEVHSRLTAKARAWADVMASEGGIRHSKLEEMLEDLDWKSLGENVGMGGNCDVLHDAFVASQSHYENLVDLRFRFVGLGVTVDADGTIFVSQEFMELASQPAPARTPGSTAGTAPSDGNTVQPISNVSDGSPSDGERPRSGGSDSGESNSSGTGASAGAAPSPRLVSVMDRLRSLDA